MPENITYKRLNRNIKLYYTHGFLSWFIISWPIEILYFAQITESYTLAMSLFALQNLGMVFFELPLNWLADKYGRKNLCLVGSFSMLLGYVCYALAGGYFLLFLGALLCGIGRSLAKNTDALLYDGLQYMKQSVEYQTIHRKCKHLSTIALLCASVFSAGAVFYSLKFAVQITILPLSIAAFISLFLTEAPFPQPRDDNFFIHLKMVLKYMQDNRRLSGLTLGESMRYGLSEASFDFNAAFFKQFVPLWSLGLFRAVGIVLEEIGKRTSQQFTLLWGMSKTVIRAAWIDSLINICAVLLSSMWSLFVRLGSPFCSGVREPTQNLLIREESPDRTFDIIVSVVTLIKSLVYVICALAIGVVADLSNPYWALLGAYIFCLLSNFLYYESLKEQK